MHAAISGSARSSEGEAIAGARVCASDAAIQALGGLSTRCVETTASGHYVIAGLRAGSYDVSVVAQGFFPGVPGVEREFVVAREGRETGQVDFILQRGGVALRGMILDAFGGPVQAAKVEVSFGERASHNISIETDEEGRFETWLTPGRAFVRASAHGYASAHTFHVAPSDDLLLRLVPGASLAGVVLDAGTGHPVPGVQVRAVCERCFDSAANPAAVSAPDGKFIIADLGVGSFALHAEGDGHRGQAQRRVEVGLAQKVQGVVVLVQKAPAVTGVVMKDGDQPCTRGLVSLGPPGDPSPFDPPDSSSKAPNTGTASDSARLPSLVASIDTLGGVRFPAVPSGNYHAVVRCDDHVLMEGPTTVQVEQEAIRDLTWKVTPGLKLVVLVVDEAGRPLPGTKFFLSWPARNGVRNRVMAATDAQGRYETPNYLYAGSYLLEPYVGHTGQPVTVEVRERAGPVEATLRLDGRGSIEVRVQTHAGAPVDAVHVTALKVGEPASNAAAADSAVPAAPRLAETLEAVPQGGGRFRLDALPSGTYTASVDDGVNTPITRVMQVSAGVVPWTVQLDRGGELRGAVLDADGTALSDVWVSATCSPQGDEPLGALGRNNTYAVRSLRGARRVLTDLQGRFKLEGIERTSQSCVVRAEEQGGSVGLARGVAPGDDITISMRAFAALSGSVRASDGSALGEYEIEVRNDEHQQRRSATFAGGSGWTIDAVAPGRVTILARAATGHMARRIVELEPGQSASGLLLELAAGTNFIPPAQAARP